MSGQARPGRSQRLGPPVREGRTRTASSRNPGTSLAIRSSPSASANRMRAAQAADSAVTVTFPLSRVQRFTLTANSGPKTAITATCHSDVSALAEARWARVGRRAEIKSPTVFGVDPGRTVRLSRRGLLGIVLRLLALTPLVYMNDALALGSGRRGCQPCASL